jgi:urease accessory protein
MQPRPYKNYLPVILFLFTAFALTSAQAHTGEHAVATGFAAGFAHPFSGMDHLLTMVAVGLWASQNRRPALWVLPILFPMMMATGALLGEAFGIFAGMESGIATTVAILGLFIAFAFKLPIALSAAIIAVFATLHGYAHGTEMPHDAVPTMYIAGFMLATATLHIAGLSIGMFGKGRVANSFTRLAGVIIASSGVALLVVS